MKLDKKRLMELASVEEAAIEGGDLLVLTLKIPLEMFKDAAESMEYGLNRDLEASPSMLKQLAATMEADLDNWFGTDGGEWLVDGISQNVYDDFLIDEEEALPIFHSQMKKPSGK